MNMDRILLQLFRLQLRIHHRRSSSPPLSHRDFPCSLPNFQPIDLHESTKERRNLSLSIDHPLFSPIDSIEMITRDLRISEEKSITLFLTLLLHLNDTIDSVLQSTTDEERLELKLYLKYGMLLYPPVITPLIVLWDDTTRRRDDESESSAMDTPFLSTVLLSLSPFSFSFLFSNEITTRFLLFSLEKRRIDRVQSESEEKSSLNYGYTFPKNNHYFANHNFLLRHLFS